MPPEVVWEAISAAAADADAIVPLRLAFWRDQTAKGVREPAPSFTADDIATLCGRARTHLLIARRGDEVGGYLYGITKLFPGAGTKISSIEEVFVDPDYRRDRLGALLVDAALTAFEHEGAARIQLRVLEENEGARAFWHSRGFAPYVTIMEKTK